MKVKIAELKANLSRYVQSLRDGGEPIEVCVREQTVAYLSASGADAASGLRKQAEVEQRLAMRGLLIRQRVGNSPRVYLPGKPCDGKQLQNSIVAMRSEKDW